MKTLALTDQHGTVIGSIAFDEDGKLKTTGVGAKVANISIDSELTQADGEPWLTALSEALDGAYLRGVVVDV